MLFGCIYIYIYIYTYIYIYVIIIVCVCVFFFGGGEGVGGFGPDYCKICMGYYMPWRRQARHCNTPGPVTGKILGRAETYNKERVFGFKA